jgi:hypothetical protein
MHNTMSGGRSRRKKLVRSKRLSKTDSEVEQENINAAQSSEAATEDTTEGAAAASETNQEEPVQTSSAEAAEGAEAQAVTEAEEISEIDLLQTGSSELEQLPPPLETVTVPEEIRESVEKLRKNLAACEDLALSDNLEDLDDTDAEIPLEAGKCISQKK